MTTKKYFLSAVFSFVLFVSAINAFGQTTSMRVFYFRGTVQYKNPGSNYNAINQVNIILKENQTVKVGTNSQLVLIHPNGKQITLSKPVEILVSELIIMGNASNGQSLIDSYINFLWKETTAGHQEMDPGKKESTTQKGMVVRGNCDGVHLDFPYDGSEVTDSILTFNWTPYVGTAFSFRVYDAQGGPDWPAMYSQKVSTQSLTINLDTGIFAKYDSLYWDVYQEGMSESECPHYLYVKRDVAFNDNLKKDFANLDLSAYDAPMKELLLGAFYEKHRMYSEAREHYQAAVKLAPDNVNFSETLKKFEERVGK